jgi:hypothetical protein
LFCSNGCGLNGTRMFGRRGLHVFGRGELRALSRFVFCLRRLRVRCGGAVAAGGGRGANVVTQEPGLWMTLLRHVLRVFTGGGERAREMGVTTCSVLTHAHPQNTHRHSQTGSNTHTYWR